MWWAPPLTYVEQRSELAAVVEGRATSTGAAGAAGARPLSVLALQIEPCSLEDPTFRKELRRRLSLCPQTQLVLLPELHFHASRMGLPVEEVAVPIPGALTDRLCQLAAELGVWLVPGSLFEAAPDGKVYNTALAISPAGEVVATYRKCFPWRPFEKVAPGTSFTVFDIPNVGRVGLSICYDLWFPELARHLAWLGAEVILQPTCTYTADRQQELVLAQATAITQQVYVVNVNAAAPFAAGRSLIVDPEGGVRVRTGEAPMAMSDTIDLAHVARVRELGTAGVDRVWRQFESGGAQLPLPLYDGRLTPDRWRPAAFGRSPDELETPHANGSRSCTLETTSQE